MTEVLKNKPWNMILYEESDLPDNYIHKDTFLKLKQINGKFYS